MKYRKGFITNSSSSSFILAYNEDSIEKSIWSQLKKNYEYEKAGEYFGYLMHYIEKENNIKNDKNFLEDLKKSLFYICKFEIEEEMEKEGFSCDKIFDYMSSEKGKIKVIERVQEKVNVILENCKGYDTIKKLTISNDYEPLTSLEYYIVKELEECKAKISHH